MENNIDVEAEVKFLESMLSRVASLVTLEESIKSSGEIALLSDTACELANTIKYLKSNIVYESQDE